MVSGFGLAGGGRRKVGEMGTDDLGKRNPAGGGRSDRKAAAELEKSASGEIYRRFFVPVRRLVTGTGGSVDPAWCDDRAGDLKDPGSWEDRRTLSDDMRSKRRAGGGVSCAACRRDVCDRGDP